MSIVPLQRATFMGLSTDKSQLLDDLHRFGSLEIIPLCEDPVNTADGAVPNQSRDALKFLLSSPQRRGQIHDSSGFDAAEVQRRALELQDQLHSLTAQRDDLLQRRAAAKPFGDFQFVPLEQMGDLRLWFYVVPHKQMANLPPASPPLAEARPSQGEGDAVALHPPSGRVARNERGGFGGLADRQNRLPPPASPPLAKARPSQGEGEASSAHDSMLPSQAPPLAWQVVSRDARFAYVVVVSPEEPAEMPVARARIGPRGPRELTSRLEEVELAIEDVQGERTYLTRWCLLFARSLTRLEDAAARADAAHQTYDSEPLFALQAWVPTEHIAELTSYAQQRGFVFEARPPRPDEQPPTLVRNGPRVEAGEDLVNFYMTPGYWTWDPSAVVFVSFAIFFAMILADAGYAALLGLGLLLMWRKLGRPTTGDTLLTSAADIELGKPPQTRTTGQRFRPMLLLIVLVSLAYGMLTGSYFGIAPPADSLLGRLHVLDINNSQLMMGISVLVGAAHVILANLMNARRFADWRDGLASIGWAMAVAGGLMAAAAAAIPSTEMLKIPGGVIAVSGLLLVVGFTARHEKPLGRVLGGLLGLTKISGAFGDILSYLRLFALGLASASLATAFNDMAIGIRSSLPRFGLLLALLVLIFGHALNLLLGVSSGVIHGLRLNVIEFFNWGLKDEGRRFTPFRRKEGF
ncbi:V-type ATP synthase subunit I [Roseimaritima ulvae]|uniref:V-type ATP synthase subunit I n=1 Tax=Roseimaritima ulvae TaxID=980254 RepID=A0A5B9R8W9_9BACT|nr:ATPase V [Roseimaritima ulvae]QEG43143.1 V-type ATP synthase subunit I [Roseimaritima ulvae]